MKHADSPSWTSPCLIATALLAGCAASERAPIDLLLTNARVIVGTGEVLSRASILIDNGLIVDLWEDDSRGRPAMRTVDAGGHTVLAGLIDTHVHLLVGDGNPGGALIPLSSSALSAYLNQTLPARLRSYLARGFTTVLSTGDFFPAILEVRDRTAADPRLGPRVLVVGPVVCAKDGHPARTICGSNAWCADHLAREVTTVAGVDTVVKELAAAKVDMIKIVHDAGLRSSLSSDLLAAALRGARDRQLRALVHAGSVAEAAQAVTMGADRLVHPPSLGTVESPDFARTLNQRGVSVASTLAISFVSDEWETAQARRPRYLSTVSANARQLSRAGVTLAYGTDVPMLSIEDAFDLELRLLADAGFSPPQIIQLATRNAAAFLGILDEAGTIERGKRADLLVVRGDPLRDLGALRNVELVLRGGQVVFKREDIRPRTAASNALVKTLSRTYHGGTDGTERISRRRSRESRCASNAQAPRLRASVVRRQMQSLKSVKTPRSAHHH